MCCGACRHCICFFPGKRVAFTNLLNDVNSPPVIKLRLTSPASHFYYLVEVCATLPLPATPKPSVSVNVHPRGAGLTLLPRSQGTVKLTRVSWAIGPSVRVNGLAPAGAAPTPGSFLALRRAWSAGDRIELTLPAVVTLSKLDDDRAAYVSATRPVRPTGARTTRGEGLSCLSLRSRDTILF